VAAPPLTVLWPPDRAGSVIAPDDAEDELAGLYAYPDRSSSPGGPARSVVRANMIASVDGAAVGADGLTGTLNDDADLRVFVLLRALADVVLVGAGTIRAEGYGPLRVRPALAERRAAAGLGPAPRLAVVTRSGEVPEEQGLFGGDAPALVMTCAAAGERTLDRLRGLAGDDGVVVAGDETVDLAGALDALARRGLGRVLCEGGPALLGHVAAAGRLDELCLTTSPRLTGGDAARIVTGAAHDQPMRLAGLLEHEGTLIARWVRA
jgi:riboflavin biosynthesis pyrimidine reductase